MALKQDERALLQLVCERGQSYADLAELLGISEDAVRDKARGALRTLGDADPDAQVGLTDYLLGQADPIGRADVVRHLQHDDADRELAAEIAAKLRVLLPGAELPTIPEPRGRRRPPAAPSPSEVAAERSAGDGGAPTASRRARLPAKQARLIAGLGAAGLIVLFAVLAVAGVFSSDEPTGAAATPESQSESTVVELDPVRGSGVGGVASFGIAGGTTLFADLRLDGLDPNLDEDRVYLMWLMVAEDAGYPIPVQIAPNDNGAYQSRIPIPNPVAQVVGGIAQTVQISETNAAQLDRTIRQAINAEDPQVVVAFSGKALATGEIPLAEGSELAEPEAGELPGGQGGGGQDGGGGGNRGGRDGE